MIKIFSSTKIIYLTSSYKDYTPKDGSILAAVQSKDEMKFLYDEFIAKSDLSEIYFFNADINVLFNYFSRMFLRVEAAGGLVKNNNDEWLFIFRNDKWDLPKGKVEQKETIKAAAIREVEEECGVSGLTIVKKASLTYHVYVLEKKAVLKCTHWYEMYCNDTSKLIPQLEEGITDVKWISKQKFYQVYENTYESIKEVMEEMN